MFQHEIGPAAPFRLRKPTGSALPINTYPDTDAAIAGLNRNAPVIKQPSHLFGVIRTMPHIIEI